MASNLMKHHLNALWQWCVEDTGKCDIIVKYEALDQKVFAASQKDGFVRLNIGPSAVRGLTITSRNVTFDCWVDGGSVLVDVAIEAVVGVIHPEIGVPMIPGLVAFQDVNGISLFAATGVPEEVGVEPPIVEGNVVYAAFGKKS